MEENINIPVMWGIKEASEKTGISYDHVRRLCLQGRVKCIRVGEKRSKILINAASLVEVMNGSEGARVPAWEVS